MINTKPSHAFLHFQHHAKSLRYWTDQAVPSFTLLPSSLLSETISCIWTFRQYSFTDRKGRNSTRFFSVSLWLSQRTLTQYFAQLGNARIPNHLSSSSKELIWQLEDTAIQSLFFKSCENIKNFTWDRLFSRLLLWGRKKKKNKTTHQWNQSHNS